jgi:CubicO group peptidase (beta-lactamase class C family)
LLLRSIVILVVFNPDQVSDMGHGKIKNWSAVSIISMVSVCLLLFGTCASIPVNSPDTHNQQPTREAWPVSTPEEQGMDSARLAAMLTQIQADNRNIHSLLIARHGTLVLEAYFHPFNRETPHNLYSCTKSVTSALMGIVVDKGLVSNLDTPAYILFPDVSVDSPDKEAITIRHLLTMSSGIEWIEPLRSGLNDTWSFIEADSPPQYFFDRALATPPGNVFNYNTGGSHLLSMIMQNASGMTTEEFARQNLFEPLGIQDVRWEKDAHGYTTGGTGLALLPEDMVKIGQLYLQQGKWNGRQILPSTWVKESTKSHIPISPGINYGYQWWVRPNGTFNALGWGGQEIIVVPAQDLVVVVTAGLRDAAWNSYDDLLKTSIVPSIRSQHRINPNQAGYQLLQDRLEAIAHPAPEIPSTSPTIVEKINGREYVDLNGTHGWSTFTFHFDGSNTAGLDLLYGTKSEEIKAIIGLDGLYRVTKTENFGPVAFKGYWKDTSTFVLTQQFLREAERLTMTLTFTDEGINRHAEWTVEDHNEDSEAVFLYR